MADIDELQIKVNASARSANAQLDKLCDKLLKLKHSMAGVNGAGINEMANGLKNFTQAASGLNQVKTADVSRLVKNIDKLTNIRKGELKRTADAIQNINKAFGGLNLGSGATQLADLGKAISKMGGKNATTAIQNMPRLAKALREMITEMSKAPQVSEKVVRMSEALATLSGRSGGVRSVANSFNQLQSSGSRTSRIIHTITSRLRNYTNGLRGANNGSKSFAHYIGKMYANFWMLRRGISALKDSVISATDYIEQHNFYNVALGKISSEWSKDYKKYGYKNADEYGKSFSNRIQDMTSKMTGFKMNDDGTLTDLGIKNLGVDATEITKFSANIAQLTNSLGLCGEASTITSKALSMISADQASYMNLTTQEAMQNFSSGIIGQSRALYKYGIDITNNTLQQYAYANGIKKSVSEMTQAEKMQLRMLAILDQSKVAYGDLAHTINSPSNQIKLLKNNLAALSRTIGNIFLPIVAKVLPYVNGLVIAIRRLFEWTASMLGLDLKDVIGNSGTGYDDTFADVAEDADDTSKAIDGATDSAKKFNKQLMGFDELNNMTSTQSSSGNGGDGGSSGVGGDPIDLTSQMADALADYEKVWNKAYDDMTSDAEKFADKLTKLFKDAWQSGDGGKIGKAIADWLNKGIKWVSKHQNKFKNALKKVANIIATGINGFIEKFDWSGFGDTLGEMLKGAIEATTNFFKNVNWLKLGKSLAKSLNSFIKTGFLTSYGHLIAAELRAAIETAFGFVTTFDFKGLGKAIGKGINAFFDDMGKVNKETNLNGWQELGRSISKTITGAQDTIITALSEIKWKDVGQAIADCISSVDWGKITWNLGKMGKSFCDAFSDTVSGLFGGGFFGNLLGSISIPSIVIAVGAWKLAKPAVAALSKAIMAKILLVTGSASIATLGLKIGAVAIAWTGGMSIGKAIGSKIANLIHKDDGISVSADWKFTDYSIGEWKDGMLAWIADMGKWLKDKAISIRVGIATKAPDLWDIIKEKFSALKDKAIDIPITLSAKVGDAKEEIRERYISVKNWWEKNAKLPNIKMPSAGDLKKALMDAWGSVKAWWGANVKLPQIKFPKIDKSTVKSWLSPVVAFVNDLIDYINKLLKIEWKDFKVAGKTIVKGGSFTIATIPNIKGFANGGLPETGQMFIAREAGPELVGNIGGHTAVVNNTQIVSSVSDGVARAIVPVMVSMRDAIMQSNNNTNGYPSEIVVKVGDTTLGKAAIKGINKVQSQHGKLLLNI